MGSRVTAYHFSPRSDDKWHESFLQDDANAAAGIGFNDLLDLVIVQSWRMQERSLTLFSLSFIVCRYPHDITIHSIHKLRF